MDQKRSAVEVFHVMIAELLQGMSKLAPQYTNKLEHGYKLIGTMRKVSPQFTIRSFYKQLKPHEDLLEKVDIEAIMEKCRQMPFFNMLPLESIWATMNLETKQIMILHIRGLYHAAMMNERAQPNPGQGVEIGENEQKVLMSGFTELSDDESTQNFQAIVNVMAQTMQQMSQQQGSEIQPHQFGDILKQSMSKLNMPLEDGDIASIMQKINSMQ